VAAIFMSRLLNGNAPMIFEDGLQSRDFVHVSDVARAFALALEREDVSDVALNVGTGRATSVLDIARLLEKALGVERAPEIVAKFREGDIRHCIADNRLAGTLLGFTPAVSLEEGFPDLIRWAKSDTAADRVTEARSELEARGLVR
jgi:dTDP-L-rhamnose 4-epimerase